MAGTQAQIVENSTLTANDATAGQLFGYATAAHSGRFVVGARSDDTLGGSAGAAYVFDLTLGTGDVISYCPPMTSNSVSPSGALLTSSSGFGTSLARFDVVNVPDSFGLLFAGDAAVQVALGCGTRCIGGSLVRGPVVVASNNQVLSMPFGMSVGVTHVHYWYRDSGTCSSGFDLSNALRR